MFEIDCLRQIKFNGNNYFEHRFCMRKGGNIEYSSLNSGKDVG